MAEPSSAAAPGPAPTPRVIVIGASAGGPDDREIEAPSDPNGATP